MKNSETIKNILSRISLDLATIESLLQDKPVITAIQTPDYDKYIGEYKHNYRDAFIDSETITAHFDGKKVFGLRKDGSVKDFEFWTCADVKRFVDNGTWVNIEKPRKFRSKLGLLIFNSNGEHIYAKYVEFKDGKFYFVLKNGYRKDASSWRWTVADMDKFVKLGLWIEQKS